MPEPPAVRRRPFPPPPLPFVLAAAAAGLAAWLIVSGHRLMAGVAGSLALAIFAAGAFQRSAIRRPRTIFAGRLVDRVFEACLLAPVAWVTRDSSTRVAGLALVGLGASYLASYERARGEALGYRELEGRGFRSMRFAILVFGLLTGWLEASLWAFVVLTVAAGVVRAANVARQERRVRAAARAAG